MEKYLFYGLLYYSSLQLRVTLWAEPSLCRSMLLIRFEPSI